jgi:steroid 5-alpha reductase family enzyme
LSETNSSADATFWRGLSWVILSYLFAFAVGVATASVVPGDPLWKAWWGDVAATCVVFIFSFAFSNSSFYDPYWSVVPVFVAGGWVIADGSSGDRVRQALLIGAFALWGARLTANWLRTWSGLHHEDWRYIDLKQKTGIFYWLVSLTGIHLFPTLLVFLGLWPAYEAIRSPTPLGWMDYVALVCAVAATVLEHVADNQMHAFKARGPAADQTIDEGLWRWSRHPNYLGEILFWWSIWLFALAADVRNAETVVGALAMTALFRFISIPMMEQRNLAKRPSYAETMRTTSMLLFWPRRP